MSSATDAKATLVLFNPVLGKFVVKNPMSDAAFISAKKEIGDTSWKQGYTPEKSALIEKLLCDAGVYPIIVTGGLKRVYQDETRDSQGNTYVKVRLILEDPLETIMVSLEAASEIASVALQLLFNAQPGDTITISSYTEKAVRKDRTYYNHRVCMTRPDGSVLSPMPGAWKKAQDAADNATKQLKEMNMPSLKQAINKLATDTKMEFHLNLLREEIGPRFK